MADATFSAEQRERFLELAAEHGDAAERRRGRRRAHAPRGSASPSSTGHCTPASKPSSPSAALAALSATETPFAALSPLGYR